MRPLALLMLALFTVIAAPSAEAGNEGLRVEKVTDGVYAIVGPLGQRDEKNLGNNATFGAVITSKGVVLIDTGGTKKGAMAIEAAVKTITDKPIIAVINTGGQDHRWLGNDYFRAKGAAIIASAAAVADQKDRFEEQYMVLGFLVKEAGRAGTEPAYADVTFDLGMETIFGETKFVIMNTGPAHTPGDSFVWLPGKKTVFTGDIVYTERMLAILSVSGISSWIEAFDAIAALKPEHVVPGHGHPTDLKTARAQTRDYLAHVKKNVGAVIKRGGKIAEAIAIDQSAFKGLLNFDQLARRNTHQAFILMEFE